MKTVLGCKRIPNILVFSLTHISFAGGMGPTMARIAIAFVIRMESICQIGFIRYREGGGRQ
ncbi:MAG: hypothetical protein DMG31_04485 [Acidobacteria bacterium]|nr:MAG: hypothetical protein DMG31_04485 [Acidobacteriota bacterium]